MNDRKEILTRLIRLEGDIYELKKELEKFEWDYDGSLYTLTRKDILNAINRFQSGGINVKGLEDWADFLECREDLDYESDFTCEVINILANPVLYGDLSPTHLENIKTKLS